MNDLALPLYFFDSFYDGECHPLSDKCDGIENGANCQYYVFEILRYFGKTVQNQRSSELWSDTVCTERTDTIELLDIVFFNKTSDPYGAHIGICVGKDRFLHLAKEIGYPTVWNMDDFLQRDIYKVFIGAKKVM